MKLQFAVISPLGTFESDISENMSQTKIDEFRKMIESQGVMNFFSITKGGVTKYFFGEILHKSIIEMRVLN